MLIETLGSARDMGRLNQILGVLIRHGFGDSVRRLGLADRLERAGHALRWEHAADLAKLEPPVQLRLVLEELGPTFVKLGQILAGRADLFPPEYIAEFEKLHSNVPGLPLDELRDLLKAEHLDADTVDAVWRQLCRHTREWGEPWTAIATGIALPGLTRMAGKILTGGRARFDEDVASEMMTAFLTALGFGVVPALHATRQHPSAALGTSPAGSGGTRAEARVRRALVGGQIALSLGLLAAAFQLTSPLESLAEPPGTDPDRLLMASFDLAQLRVSSGESDVFYAALLDRDAGGGELGVDVVRRDGAEQLAALARLHGDGDARLLDLLGERLGAVEFLGFAQAAGLLEGLDVLAVGLGERDRLALGQEEITRVAGADFDLVAFGAEAVDRFEEENFVISHGI